MVFSSYTHWNNSLIYNYTLFLFSLSFYLKLETEVAVKSKVGHGGLSIWCSTVTCGCCATASGGMNNCESTHAHDENNIWYSNSRCDQLPFSPSFIYSANCGLCKCLWWPKLWKLPQKNLKINQDHEKL